MRLLLFNPDTDLAQATGHIAYTPKKGVEQMRRDLFPLMGLFSCPGDRLLLPQGVGVSDAQGCVWLKDYTGVGFASEEDIPHLPLSGVLPWGWNRSVAFHLGSMGVPNAILPSDDVLIRHRDNSSRAILERLSICFDGQEGLEARSWNLYDIKEVQQFLDGAEEYVFKAPYSSSGKGLLWPHVLGRDLLLRRAATVLRQSGLLTVQKAYDKVLDLAMEFSVWQGKACFTGYSLFKTNSRGLYEGNMCLSDELSESFIRRWIPLEILHKARSILLEELPKMGYEGPLGVDMIIARDSSGGFFLVPLLEVNLRHTMGMVANEVHKRLLDPASAAFLKVDRFAGYDDVISSIMRERNSSPLVQGPSGLVSGYLPLSFLDISSQFLCGLQILPCATLETPSVFLGGMD